jgi:hypothetical protein
MILRLSSPAACILLALLASMLATGAQPWTEVELPWTSGNDVRGLHLCVSRLPSAKFPNKIGGSAWIDDVSLVPQSAENTKQ